MPEALPPCTRCGAQRSADAPIYCTFCGAQQATGVADPAAYRTLPERYDLVAKQPGYERAMAWQPRLSVTSEVGSAVVAAAVFGGFTALWLVGARVVESPGWFLVVGGVICALAVAIGLSQVVRSVWRVLAPMHREVGVIAGEDDAQETRGFMGSRFRIRVRARDGEIRVLIADHDNIALVAPGDIGIAYVQADRLVDYRWFDVMPMPLAAGEPPRAPSCPGCAAPLSFETRARCLYCNAELPEPDLGEHGAAFAAIAGTPAAKAALAREIAGGLPPRTAAVVLTVVGAAGLSGVLYLHVVWFWLVERSPWFLFVPAPFALLFAIGMLWWVRRSALRRPPVEHAVAFVMRRRKVKIGEVNDQPVFLHFATLLARSGGRKELRALPAIIAPVTDRRYGVAHTRGGWLVGFDAIDVPRGEA